MAIAAGPGWTPVLDADDADSAVKFILQNNSDTDMELSLGNAAVAGFFLYANGGSWEEDRYAGVVFARHGGVGAKNLTRVLF